MDPNADINQIPEEKRRRGRPKGSHNKTAVTLKEAILQAADTYRGEEDKAGLVGWLEKLREKEPKAFATLLGRILPLQVTGNSDADSSPIQVSIKLVKPPTP